MTRAEFEQKTFTEVIEELNEQRDDITTYERLKEFTIENIKEDNFLLAVHILEALRNDVAEWYEYDYSMGTLQSPSGITEKIHIEHLIED